VTTVPLLSNAAGNAAAGFGVLGDTHGVPRTACSAFLVRDGIVVAARALDGALPTSTRSSPPPLSG
jgi:hypothetical protein